MLYTVDYLGDRSLVCNFGEDTNIATHQKVLATEATLLKNKELDFVNMIPSPNTLVLNFADYTRLDTAWKTLEDLQCLPPDYVQLNPQHWDIPACYDREFGLDQSIILDWTQKSLDEVIHVTTKDTFYMYSYGGIPGQMRLGNTEWIGPPKLEKYRMDVPAGSIGWSGNLVNSYPIDCSGGWAILCRILPYPDPYFIKPGDTVKFYPVSRQEYDAKLNVL